MKSDRVSLLQGSLGQTSYMHQAECGWKGREGVILPALHNLTPNLHLYIKESTGTTKPIPHRVRNQLTGAGPLENIQHSGKPETHKMNLALFTSFKRCDLSLTTKI